MFSPAKHTRIDLFLPLMVDRPAFRKPLKQSHAPVSDLSYVLVVDPACLSIPYWVRLDFSSFTTSRPA